MDATVKQQAQTTRAHLAQRKKLFFWAALVFLALIVCVAVVEIALRAFYREEEVVGDYFGLGGFVQDDEVGYRHAPGFKGSMYRHHVFDCPVSISSLGLRQTNFDDQMQFPQRLLVLGDSYVFGVGVQEEAIFTTLAQPVLNSEGFGVINGGQSGYGVAQEAKLGMRLAQTVKPAMIILSLYPGNDVIGDYYKDYENVEVRYGQRLSKDRWLPTAFVDFFRGRSYGWMLLEVSLKRKRIEEQRKAFNKFAQDNTALVMQPMLNALGTLRDYCRANGIKFGVMLVPAGGKSLFDTPLKQALTDDSIPVLDLGQQKFTRKHYFRGDAHWNEEGHKRVAKHFVPFCLEFYNNEKINER